MACHVRIEDLQEEHTKQCRVCGRELPISSFYTHRDNSDGHSHKCKRCTQDANSERRSSGVSVKRARYLKTNQCPDCEGLSWRRNGPLCRTCLEPYEPEDMGFTRQEIIERRKWDQSWIYSR